MKLSCFLNVFFIYIHKSCIRELANKVIVHFAEFIFEFRGRPFDFWGGGGGVGDFEKKYPASAYA